MLEPVNRMEFFKDYEAMVTIEKLAEKNFVCMETVKRWIRMFNLSRNRRMPAPSKSKIIKLVAEKKTRKAIAELVGVKPNILDKYIKQYGIETHFNQKKVIHVDMDEVYRLRVEEKWPFSRIGRYFKLAESTIRMRCVAANFPKVKVKIEWQPKEWKLACNKNNYKGTGVLR